MIRRALCCAVVGLFVFGLLAGFGKAEDAKPVIQKSQPAPSPKGYTTHEPIRINNDADFTAQFSNRTIWGLEINGTGKGFCLFIGNCSQKFSIKNCYLHNASTVYKPPYYLCDGLDLFKSWNGTIENNNISGVSLSNTSCLNLVNKNTLYSGFCGLIISGSSNFNVVTYNSILLNDRGIFMQSSNNNTIRQNTLFGITISDGISLDQLSIYNNISENKIYLYGNGIYLSKNANRNNLTNNIILSCLSDGIQIFSNNNLIVNNTINYNGRGIYAYETESTIISYNSISKNLFEGIGLGLSSKYIIAFNNLTANSNYGIALSGGCTMNYVYENNFIDNNPGFPQAFSNEKNFWNNSSDGNYWSDYSTRYPFAINDGHIWNYSYVLNGSLEKDFFPLVYPVPDAGAIPEFFSSPAIMLTVLLLTAIVVRRRGR